jgi:hypothetical protein
VTQTDFIIYGTLITVVIVIALIAWWGIRSAHEAEAAATSLTAEKLRTIARSRLLPGPLSWGAWRDVNTVNQKRMEITDANDARITTVYFPPLPVSGVMEHFELDGKRYEIVNEGIVSGRVWLREAGTGDVVLSCTHHVGRITIYRGKTDIEVVRIHSPGLISEISKMMRGDEKIGHLFYDRTCHVRVISLQRPSLSVLEQCFAMIAQG